MPNTNQDMARVVSVDGWTWRLVGAFELSWFREYPLAEIRDRVKANDNRVVFKVRSGGVWHYVKHERPMSWRHRLRNAFLPKARSEFKSAVALSMAGVPVVEMAGWGRRGGECMLVSKELSGSRSARDLWHSTQGADAAAREPFLGALSNFIRIFLEAGGRHPDMHLGNLLTTGSGGDLTFHLVDPYGAGVGRAYGDSRRSGIWMLAGAVREALDFERAAEFLVSSKLAADTHSARELWRRIIRHEAEENIKSWPRRRDRILKGRSRLCVRADGPEGVLRYTRLRHDGIPAVPESEFDSVLSGSGPFEVLTLGDQEAESLWLRSFLLQYHLIRHRRPVAWLRTGGESRMVFERLLEAAPFDPSKSKDFLERCALSEVAIKDPKSQIVMFDGVPRVADIRAIEI